MSNNALNWALATGAVVAVANVVEKKSVSAPQVLGTVIYALALSAVNTVSPDVATKFALLVLVGVALTRGYTVLTKVKL